MRASAGDSGVPRTWAASAAVRLGVERLERELAQRPGAAQLVAQAAQRMRARDLVGAIGAHDEDRQLAQRIGERPEQLQGGVVGPLQVVEQDHRRGAGGDRRQRAAQRLEQRRPVALGDRRPELGQQQREVPLQRAARGQRARRAAQVAAQGAQHRAVGQRRRRARRAAQRQRIARRRDLLGQAGLADPGLAGQQHERAAPCERIGDGFLEPPALGLAPDERRAPHGASLRRAGCAGHRQDRLLQRAGLGAVAVAATASARVCQPSIRSSSDMPRTSRW